MKHLAIAAMILWVGSAWAYSCPKDLQNTRRAVELHHWLNHFQGRLQVGGCQIEITACDLSAEPGISSMIGEIYIVDKRGREAYLPLSYIPPGSREGETHIQFFKQRLVYLKRDKLYEEEYGRTEVYRLDMRVSPDYTRIVKLDLGTYATNKKLNMPNGNQSRWYNCFEGP